METLASGFLWLAGAIGFNTELMTTYGPRLIAGCGTTALIVVLTMPIGALLAYPLAMARLSKRPLLRNLAAGYIYVLRGTPQLAQLFLIYAGLGTLFGSHRAFLEDLGLWKVFREGFYYVIFAFSLNTAAYQAEILRGGIESVPRGQSEAAAALGLHQDQIFRKIVLPQALIVGLRPYGNELILVIKGSSVASLVTVFDVIGQTRFIFSRSYDFEVYLWAAIIYLVVVEGIRRLWDAMETRITRHLRQTPIEAKARAMPRETAAAA